MHGELRLDVEAIAEYLGIEDLELLVDGLHALAEHQESLRDTDATTK
jgi:hypothetical protein